MAGMELSGGGGALPPTAFLHACFFTRSVVSLAGVLEAGEDSADGVLRLEGGMEKGRKSKEKDGRKREHRRKNGGRKGNDQIENGKDG